MLLVPGPIWRTGALALRLGVQHSPLLSKSMTSIIWRSKENLDLFLQYRTKGFQGFTPKHLHQPVAILAFMCKTCNFFVSKAECDGLIMSYQLTTASLVTSLTPFLLLKMWNSEILPKAIGLACMSPPQHEGRDVESWSPVIATGPL